MCFTFASVFISVLYYLEHYALHGRKNPVGLPDNFLDKDLETRHERSKYGDSCLFLKLARVLHFLVCSLVQVYLSRMVKKM